jgi:hypothetical protein
MKPILVILLFLSIQLISLAQTVIVTPDPNTRSDVNVYNGYQAQKRKEVIVKNAFTLNPLGIFIGDFPLYYERQIVRQFHIQAAYGITSTNFMYNIFGPNFLTAVDSSNSVFNGNFNRTSSLGQTYMVQPKFYFGRRDFEGFFMGLEYRHRQYNYVSTEYSGTSLNTTVHESRKVNDILFMIGGSHVFGNHINFQYYMGFGTRTNIYNYAKANTFQGGGSGNVTNFTYSMANLTQNTIAFTTGITLGVAF